MCGWSTRTRRTCGSFGCSWPSRSGWSCWCNRTNRKSGRTYRPTGNCWSTGAAGPIGPQGLVGPIGPQGIPGLLGPVGPQGSIGPVGPTGAFGAQGTIGPAGPAGSAGVAGVAGPVGPAGEAGPQGLIGPAGAVGQTGSQGAIGPAGPAGVAGPMGSAGAQGPAGPIGPIGPTGSQGAVGPQGPQGNAGIGGIISFAQYVQYGAQPGTIAPAQPFTYTNAIITSLNINTVTAGGGTIFILSNIGIYEVNYQMTIPAAGSVVIYLGASSPPTSPVPYAMIGKNPDGQMSGSVLIQTTTSPSYLSINAAAGNTAALQVETVFTNQTATTVSFKQIA